jgi:glycerophosphoryl diester phosphodiesterase
MFLQVQAQYIPKFDLQGHRGARGLKPENTIPAFITALDFGVTTLELDVVITKDKQVIVSHEPYMSPSICLDSTGQLFTDEKKFNIYKLTYEEIRSFDCGSKGNDRFPEQIKEVVQKPLLKDVIIAVENHIKNKSSYEVDYNIEIKSSEKGDNKEHPSLAEFSDLVYKSIDEYLPWQRVVIQSFDFRVLNYWHKKYPNVRLAALVENVKSPESNLKSLGFTPSIYSPYYKLLNKEKIDYLHSLSVENPEKAKAKLRVIPWTVNEPSEMLELKAMGVDGLITDYPDRAASIGLTLPSKK